MFTAGVQGVRGFKSLFRPTNDSESVDNRTFLRGSKESVNNLLSECLFRDHDINLTSFYRVTVTYARFDSFTHVSRVVSPWFMSQEFVCYPLSLDDHGTGTVHVL